MQSKGAHLMQKNEQGHVSWAPSGPPIEWARMCGPMQGAILGAVVYEGLANDLDAASALIESGEITLAPCHDHDAVAPMAGVISPSMPVWVIEDRAHGVGQVRAAGLV